MTKKAFVLLSGGLDSTTCLHHAIKDYVPSQDTGSDSDDIDWVEAYSVNYGQRHQKEMEYAKATCDRLGIQHTILDVGALLRGDSVMLTTDSIGKVDVPNIDYADIRGVSPTYVPFRNGLLLSAITAQAQKWVNKANAELTKPPGTISIEDFPKEDRPTAGVYFGAHAEDAHNWAYPDCTPEFIGAMANAIYIGSYMQIRLHTPLEWLNKSQVVTLGDSLGVDFKGTWSCYKGEEKHCGTCPTCRSRKQGFIAARVPDPTEYTFN